MASGPSVAVLYPLACFKSEQILLDKSVKVKAAASPELAATRREIAISREEDAANVAIMQRVRKSRPAVPPLLEPKGFPSYVRRLERELRVLDRAPQGDSPERTAGAQATPERIGSGAEGALGNNTESRAGFTEGLDEKTGEIQRLTVHPKSRELVVEVPQEFASLNARANRLSAQSAAGRLLAHEVTPRGTQWRVSGCIRRKVGAEVAVMYSPSMKKAHFGGLMVCGSVWTCPPCAAKVSERRKLEVVQATDLHKAQGGGLYLVTLTAPHKRDHALAEWLRRFSDARERMRRQRAYLDLVAMVGQVGNIRALEVTYGDSNGWHPHEHSLWLLEKPLTDSQLRKLRSGLFDLWRRACVAAGLPAPNRVRGVDVRVMESAAEYVAKFGREPRWGVGSEMAKQHSKVGQAKSLTPFDLLRLYQVGSDDGSHKRFGALFVVFAKAFFGKRQIVWSRGLKALFGIEQVSDEEVAEQEADDAAELVSITPDQWRCVLHQKQDVRQIILERAETGGHLAVLDYLNGLMENFYPFCRSPVRRR